MVVIRTLRMKAKIGKIKAVLVYKLDPEMKIRKKLKNRIF